MRRWLLSMVCLAALAAPAMAQIPPSGKPPLSDADPLHYDTVHEGWNGLSSLASLARGFGLKVRAVEQIDWDEIGGEHILVILYPENRLDPGHLSGFIRAGGHVLLADDFGQGSEAMARLGMLRRPALGVGADRFYNDLPWAPVAKPFVPDHPLAKGVDEVTTNHPAVLTRVKGSTVVFGFGRGEGVIAAGELGAGRFVVASDPSIFINRMLQFPGNLQLAINVLRYLQRRNTTELIVLTGDFGLYGIPRGAIDDGTMRGSVARVMNDFNRWLDERNDYLIREGLIRLIGVLVALVVGVLALLALPLIRRTRLDGEWTRAAPGSTVLHDFEELIEHYDAEGRRGSYLLPAAVLRDTVNASLSRILDTTEPLYSMTEKQLYERIREERGAEAARSLERVYRRLRLLPSRLQAASPWTSGFLSRREFERLHEDVSHVFTAIEAQSRAERA
jgi:hypothetical protein